MKNLEKQAIGIVAQLFDLAEVPVDKRQEINDVAYDYVTEQLIITDVGYCKKKNAISDKEYIKIFELYREEFTCVADDEQLKKWGNSDEEIKYIKIRGGRSILLTYKEGIKIAKSLQEMNLL